MQLVPASSIRMRYSNSFPREMEVVCPHCRKQAMFEAGCWQEHGRHVAAVEAPCSRCEGEVLFVQMLDELGSACDSPLYRNPPSPERQPLAGVDQLNMLSASLGRSYDSALRLYNQGELAPAVLTLRHLLESLLSQLTGSAHRDLELSGQLQALPQAVDLARPLKDIAPLLADGGSFDRQVDDETALDQRSVGQLLELTEHLISYLVVLPGAMDELKDRVETAPVPLRRGATG